MRKAVLIILVIALVLFYIAPNHVDKAYCWVCLALFVIEATFILRLDLKSGLYVGFNTLFFISFFLTSFAYPLFVYETPADLLGTIAKAIDYGYLTKCSTLCLVASSVYCYGYLRAVDKKKCKTYGEKKLKNDGYIGGLKFIKVLYVFLFIMLFVTAVMFLSEGGSVNLEGGDLLTSIFESIFPVVLLLNTLKEKPKGMLEFLKKNIFILALCIAMMLAFIRVGDRGLVLTCGLEIIVVYTICVKRVNLFYIGSIMVVGLILMFVIRQTRISDDYSSTTSSVSSFSSAASSTLSEAGAAYGVWYYLSDLTNISHELCLGYEYSTKNGLFHPIERIVFAILSPVPLLPSLFSNFIMGYPTSEYNTGMALNKYMEYIGDAHFGNHCVIDIYMTWRLLGVFVVFYFLGYAVASCYNKMFDNVLFAALYVLLVANAIYIPRNMVLSMIRPAVYVWFFVWLSKKHSKSSRHVIIPQINK